MPIANWPLGLQGVEQLPRTKRTLENCWNDSDGSVIHRPGIEDLQDTGKTARGSFEFNGFQYQVVSNDLIKIVDTETGAFTTNSTPITGSANIRVAIGFNTAVIVVKGSSGRIYTLDKFDIVTDIRGNANFVDCVDVAHMNGRFIFIPVQSDIFPPFFSDIGDAGSVQVLSFFDAESLPDNSNGVINYRNTLYILGTDSIEPFGDTGASPNPFLRIPRGRIDYGFIGGLIEYNQTFVFLGREKGQDFGIYSLQSGTALKISNEVIDLILSEHTSSERAEVIVSRFKWRGYDIVTFTLARSSFGFLNGNWFSLKSLFNGSSKIWAGGFISQIDGKYLTAFKNKIGRLENINTDYGETITYLIEMGFENQDGTRFSCQSIELPISQGFVGNNGVEDASVGLQMTKDGVIYGQPFFRNLGALGDYQRVLKWNFPGGLGRYRGFMGWRFFSSDTVLFSANPPIVKLR